jgi:hypothetical protein
MAARVIHFGPDDCHRLIVLESAGYVVDACDSLGQLRASLIAGDEADAVMMSDAEGVAPEEVVSVARTHSLAPVVLFRGTNRVYEDSTFDLVVHTLTPPEVWLDEVDALISKNRVLHARSEVLARESAHPKQEAAAAVLMTQVERKRSRLESARNTPPANGPQPNAPHVE